ncbi:MAG: carbohydrate ABC transporter permease [Lachnospiraceae bacterium]|jgi:multiple sugar transport system permease protein|nr:carbohydrate ABC transporter permease [Lachnospiraceae bacterium]
MTKLKRKERMQKAEEMAGISFWVDLKKGRLTKYAIQKKVKNIIASAFRYIILICLGFVVITPIWNLVKDAFTSPAMLGDKSSSWIPQQVSTIFMEMALSEKIMDYLPSLGYTLLTTAVLTFLQVLSTGLAAYSFARLKFKGSNILFFFVVLTIVVPSDALMLAQYAAFRNFDIFGLIGLIKGNGVGINMINKPISQFILAGTGMGVKSGLYIYFMRQGVRGLPISVEEAAHVDGAGFLRTFFSIVVPSMSGSILTVSVLSFLWNYTDVYYTSLLNPNIHHLAYQYTTLQGNMRPGITSAAQTNDVWLKTIDATNPFVQTATISACALLVVVPLLIMYCFVQKRFVQGAARSGLGGD